MTQVLNSISILAAFVFGTGIIYLALNYTIGRFRFLDSKFEWRGLQIKDFIFLALGAALILLFTSFVEPY